MCAIYRASSAGRNPREANLAVSLQTAAARVAGRDLVDVAIVLRMVLNMESVECQPE
jgi:hypothetical protein